MNKDFIIERGVIPLEVHDFLFVEDPSGRAFVYDGGVMIESKRCPGIGLTWETLVELLRNPLVLEHVQTEDLLRRNL